MTGAVSRNMLGAPQVAGIATLTFATEAALLRHGSALTGSDADAGCTAIYRVRDYKLV